MNCYKLKFSRRDTPKGCVSSYLKWARDEKSALAYIIQGKVGEDGLVVFKRGGSGRLISIERD